MTLLQSSSSGSILFDDCDILHHRKEIRSVLGYLPQDFRFFEKLKTWEFLDYGAGLAGIRFCHALNHSAKPNAENARNGTKPGST